ncbi:recombinase RecA [Ureaplasma miroungigenitalium]|uniref:Protein RecA n=1 Tax=Ureaplasma miroungigenitalium TaxID=1042321 RepID=A0ABT3BN59_9BACT|nr:recombinase RecA [Ureaplasma miroungigenitalium]MCV3728672.1 recombinase RecA [Ureaplasma miroungigenitalium]MCV3734363.1 recombinase RecA [Ureaplasma miroungigenitalium]
MKTKKETNEQSDLLCSLENKFARTSYCLADELNNQQIACISTGSLQIDNITGVNGIPVGRITEIFGNESSGKTTIALQTAAECQKNGGKVVFIDMEGSFDINYAKKLGINTSTLIIAQPTTGEIAFEMIETLLKTNNINLIIVDSVAAMIPENEFLNDMNETAMGAHARLMSKGLRKIQPLISRSQTAIIFLNQLREKINVFFGNPETTTGGKALRFYASLRIETRKADLIKEGINKIGIKTKVTVIKNKLAPPMQSCYIDIFFGQGFNYANEIIDFAIEYGVLKKNGSWFYYNETKIAQGREQLKKYLEENPDLFTAIQTQVIDLVQPRTTADVISENRSTDQPNSL